MKLPKEKDFIFKSKLSSENMDWVGYAKSLEKYIKTNKAVNVVLDNVSDSFCKCGFDGETKITSSDDNPLTKENAPRIKGYEIESEKEGIITYKHK